MAHAPAHPVKGWIGRPRRRIEDRSLVAGAGCFVDDVQLPGTLTLSILRSPYPHARILSVDLSAARAAPGVVDAIGGQDTAHITRLTISPAVPEVLKPDHLPLAVGEVRYVGDEVAAVLAEQRAQARDAVDLVEVEFEPLPSVADAERAARPDAPLVHERFGTNVAYAKAWGSEAEEVELALARADRVVSLRIRNPRIAPVAIEPRAILASYDPSDGTLRVWTSTQRPFFIRDELAKLMGMEPSRVRVVAPDVGGAFGSKGGLYREEVLAAYLSREHGRPVRWNATRGEEFVTTMQARDQVDVVDAGFSAQGDLLVIRVRVHANMGAYLHANTALPPTRTAKLICGPYRVPVARTEVVASFTNTVPTGPYRGAGRPEATFLLERLMDTAARELGIDRLELRRRNFVRPDELPWKTPTGVTYDSGDYPGTLDRALQLADFPGLLARREEARRRGELFGVGVSTFVEPSGGPGTESGEIRVQPDGRVLAISGSSAHGQGHRTTFAQIVADRLQVPIDDVTVVQSDTDVVSSGTGTFGSRSTALGGSALALASDAVLARMRQVAGHLLEVEAADVVYDDGAFRPVGVSNRGVTFAEVAAAAHRPEALPPGVEPGLDATELFNVKAEEAYSNGTHVAAVSIDRETGRAKIESLVAFDDGGVLINPLLVEGQVQGGLAQGIGQVFHEQMVYDDDGTVLTGSLGDYSVPHAEDVPTFVLGETQTPTPLNPLGAKGVGESGAVGLPPALANAVIDALRDEGVANVDMPLTSEKIWRLLADGQRSA